MDFFKINLCILMKSILFFQKLLNQKVIIVKN